MTRSPKKTAVVEDFRNHVSSGKAAFYDMFGLDFVMGWREGPWAWDIDDTKKVFNLHTNGGVYNLGHRHPSIIRALTSALEDVDIGNGHLVSRDRAALGRRLAELMPADLDYTVFGVSGGEAVDLAFKVARAHTGRTGIISALGGYHGHTGLAMAAGDEKYRAPFGPQLPGFSQVRFGDADALADAVDGDTAAVILETVPATLGMLMPPPDYFPRVREICDRAGTLLILDEVQTGLGRTGRLWAFEHFDVIPDIVVLGKGLSGGIYPITATVIRRPLEAVFQPDPHIHVSTFGGSEAGCRVALKVLEISSNPAFLARVNQLADRFASGLEEIKTRRPLLGDVRRLGLFMGLKTTHETGGVIMSLAGYWNDLLMVYANNDKSVCQFLPPLTITNDEADWVLERIDASLADAADMLDSD